MSKDIVLIIGASSDIGSGLIRELSDSDSIILAHYNNSEDKIKKIQAESNLKLIPVRADLLDEKQVLDLIGDIKKNYGFPNKIVHFPAPRVNNIRFKDVKWEDFQKNIYIQLKSIILILKEFLPFMAKERRGKIVFVLSSYTLNIPPKALSHYVTVKYALLGLMKSLASEYSDKAININAVSPSMVDTGFLTNIPEKIIELTAQAHPLKRNATVKDIAPVIKFLLSNSADYISGVNIPVSGGSAF